MVDNFTALHAGDEGYNHCMSSKFSIFGSLEKNTTFVSLWDMITPSLFITMGDINYKLTLSLIHVHIALFSLSPDPPKCQCMGLLACKLQSTEQRFAFFFLHFEEKKGKPCVCLIFAPYINVGTYSTVCKSQKPQFMYFICISIGKVVWYWVKNKMF